MSQLCVLCLIPLVLLVSACSGMGCAGDKRKPEVPRTVAAPAQAPTPAAAPNAPPAASPAGSVANAQQPLSPVALAEKTAALKRKEGETDPKELWLRKPSDGTLSGAAKEVPRSTPGAESAEAAARGFLSAAVRNDLEKAKQFILSLGDIEAITGKPPTSELLRGPASVLHHLRTSLAGKTFQLGTFFPGTVEVQPAHGGKSITVMRGASYTIEGGDKQRIGVTSLIQIGGRWKIEEL